MAQPAARTKNCSRAYAEACWVCGERTPLWTSCFAHSTRYTGLGHDQHQFQPPIGPPHRPCGRVPFPPVPFPPAALPRRLRRLWLFCPLRLQRPLAPEHLFDRLHHLILALKLGCLKLGEAGNELGSADVEATTTAFLPKPLPQELHWHPPSSIRPPRSSPAYLFPEPRSPE